MLPLESNFVVPSNEKDPRTDLPLPKINFAIDEETHYSQTAFTYASEVLKKMFSSIGIEGEAQTTSEIKDFAGAGHIMGTTKMGADAHSSVVDGNCRKHDHQNLFLTGAGVFPTCGTANPSLTVAALSLRLAEYIKNEFENYGFGGK